MENLLLKKSDKKINLLGNEAIIRGALESGVEFVSTYPGTPASEIGNIFNQIAPKANIHFEFSTNEKVAMEASIGASFSGLKCLVAMKNFGLNVALDSFGPFIYTGSKGPTVIIVADDPSCHSSAQWEENTRPISYLTHVPTLEPADPQECRDFVKLAFEISEKFRIPVMVRTTTRVAHQRALVKVDEYNSNQSLAAGKFVKDPDKFITMPPRVLEMKNELFEKIEKIRDFAGQSVINFSENEGSADLGIIASGITYLYVKEALEQLKINLPILKLGLFYPLPEIKINEFVKGLKKVLIAEELEPLLEREVGRLAKNINPGLEIIGKELLPVTGELKTENIILALAKLKGLKLDIKLNNLPEYPRRNPDVCPGCFYRLVFKAVKEAAPEGTVFGGDIGCYMLAGLPQFGVQDYLFNMGSSVGIAHGITKSTGQKLITFIGDSTFFHAGIPALINAVFNKTNPLIIILENQTTAMTGHQPHPGYPAQGEGIKIEEIVRACGVKNLKIIDQVDTKGMKKTIVEFLDNKEVSVIIARRLCWLLSQKRQSKPV